MGGGGNEHEREGKEPRSKVHGSILKQLQLLSRDLLTSLPLVAGGLNPPKRGAPGGVAGVEGDDATSLDSITTPEKTCKTVKERKQNNKWKRSLSYHTPFVVLVLSLGLSLHILWLT